MADFKENENKADDESAILAQSVEANKVQKAQAAINYFASRCKCHIPAPRNKSELANWSEAKLLGHIAYHVARKRFKQSHKKAVEIAEMFTNIRDDFSPEAKWLDCQLKQDKLA